MYRMTERRHQGKHRWTRGRALRWLCLLGWLLLLPQAASAADVGLFVQPGSASDDAPAAWLEGFWFHSLGQRVKLTESMLGGLPAGKLASLIQAQKAFKAGKVAFDNLDQEKAFKFFRRSVRAYGAALPYVRDFRPLAKVWAYIGVSYLLDGKKQRGAKAFRRALLYHPSLTLKGISKDQSKIAMFAQSKSALSSGTKGTLQVSSQPAGALYVDGVFAGVTPVRVDVPQGTHSVVVRRPGFRWWGKQVAVSAAPFSLRAQLTRRSSAAQWQAAGQLAANHTLARTGMPEQVQAFSAITGTKLLLLAKVRRVRGGKALAIQAAAYDATGKKQLAAGGALVSWPVSSADQQTLKQLCASLLAGRAMTFGGWSPTMNSAQKRPLPPPKTKGGGAGLAVGLVIGGLVLVGGGTVLALYLFQPQIFGQCPGSGSCVKLTIK